jgi:hypothetical protein
MADAHAHAHASATSSARPPAQQQQQKTKAGLSAGAIAGIAVGGVVGAAACSGVLLWLCYRRRRRSQQPLRQEVAEMGPEPGMEGVRISSATPVEVAAKPARARLGVDGEGDGAPKEMYAPLPVIHELPGAGRGYVR